MTSYIGILEKEPGTLWGIWFPDLAGCVAAAETSQDVLSQAPEALTQWLDIARESGQVLPRARSVEELRDDEWVKEALAKGDVAILVAPFDEWGFHEHQLKTIDEAAERRGLSRREFLRETVLEKIAS